jgi:hypothetical protein
MTDASARLPTFLSPNRSAAAPMVQQDFRLGHVLTRTVSIMRRHALPLFILYGIASVLLNAPVTFTNIDSPDVDVVIACGISLVLCTLFNVFAGAAVVDAAIDDMRGRPVDMQKAMRVALRRFFPILGVTAAVVGLAALGFAVVIVPAAMVISACFVVVPVCVVEGLGPVQSMWRSAELTKGYRWRIFAVWFAILLVEGTVQAELDQVTRPFGYFALVLAPQVAWDVVVGAFAVVLTAVTYRDLRIAKEGVDADQVATVFD